MRPQINRLTADAGAFAGTIIDRNRPLRFRLDGRPISGFAGDSVLSAVLASGIDILGHRGDWPIGLTSSASPAILPAPQAGEARHALPMARVPALDGAEFVTLGRGRPNPLSPLFRPRRSLGIGLADPRGLAQPWRGLAGESREAGDLLVIGGGVAGMAAALAAAAAGLAVTLVEAGPELGGHSELFGRQDGEDTPEAEMARLRAEIEASDAITVLLNSHAYAIRPGQVRIHRVETVGGRAEGRVIDLAARYLVIATGSRERLPIFAGNRLPGIMGTLESYLLARRYGVWPGRSALIATASNCSYRLAMLAKDAGLAIDRILDCRAEANSRFIAFSRAYGIVQMPGTLPQLASPAKGGTGLWVRTDRPGAGPMGTGRLLVCGGWQPDLTLWHLAGGPSRWNGSNQRLEAVGQLDNVALAGSAAGYFTRQGCIASGREAVNDLLGRKCRPVDDPVIDPLHESPDAPLPVAAPRDEAPPAFLDGGRKLLERPAAPRRRWLDRFRRKRAEAGLPGLSGTPEALGLDMVVAGTALGLIPPDIAGLVAQERAAMVPLLPPDEPERAAAPPGRHDVPAYLENRFGPAPALMEIVPETPRQLSSGALIRADPDQAGMLVTIGVVLRMAGERAIALVKAEAAQEGMAVSISDQGRAIAARLVSPEKTGAP